VSKLLNRQELAQVENLRTPASLVGRNWARDVAGELQLAGRRAAGGWPGTLTEARDRATHLIAQAGGSASASIAMRDEVARVLYAAARTDWLRAREPETDASDAPRVVKQRRQGA
jgi:hypothetical protein